MMEELSERERLIFAAAIFDGEGCIHIAKKRTGHFYLMLVVTNTDKRLIEWLLEVFGGGTTFRPDGRRERKDQYIWQVFGRTAYRIIKKVKPFLLLKQEQAEVAEHFYKECTMNGSVYRQLPLGIKKRGEMYYKKMRRLNKKGIGDAKENEEEVSADNCFLCNQLSLSSFY